MSGLGKWLCVVWIFLACIGGERGGVVAVDFELEPINYWEGQARDRFAQLLEIGEEWTGGTPQEVLGKILAHLEIPTESQILVYSKTSAQNARITPETPRAIYFSDECYVGWVQGGAIEVMVFDAIRGAMFYLVELDVRRGRVVGEPSRPQSCLNCHGRTPSGSIPGGLVRSVFAGWDGMPYFQQGSFAVDDSTVLENRWGGWYVTGDPGGHHHMGNAIARENESGIVLAPIVAGIQSFQDLSAVLNPNAYLGGGHSDIVALMIFEHQVKLHNVLNFANLTVRQLSYRTEEMYRSLGEEVPSEPAGTLKRVIDSQSSLIVRHLLFTDEFPLKGDGVDGNHQFQSAFLKDRIATGDGRSLKDLRLYGRLFKHRCSYLIYSQVFDNLPAVLKNEVWRKLKDGLTGRGSDLTRHLSSSERKRILQILSETHPALPANW